MSIIERFWISKYTSRVINLFTWGQPVPLHQFAVDILGAPRQIFTNLPAVRAAIRFCVRSRFSDSRKHLIFFARAFFTLIALFSTPGNYTRTAYSIHLYRTHNV